MSFFPPTMCSHGVPFGALTVCLDCEAITCKFCIEWMEPVLKARKKRLKEIHKILSGKKPNPLSKVTA